MWIRKNIDELVKKKYSYKLYLCVYTCVFIWVFLLTHYFGYGRGYNHYYNPHSFTWEESFDNISYSLGLSFILTVGLIYLYISFNKADEENIRKKSICDKCNKFEIDNSKTDCECGGIFIIMKLMKWVD